MERFLIFVCTGILAAQILWLPCLLFVTGCLRKRRGLRQAAWIVLAAVLVWAVLTALYPPMVWPGEMDMDRAAAKEIIRPVAEADRKLPLFLPVLVNVEECEADFLRWRTYYIPFGWREHIWGGTEGLYEQTKPLVGW